MGDFRILLCDPPWSFSSRSPWKKTRFGGGVAGHYDVMSTADICALGEAIKPQMAERAVCLMWTTGTHMEDAYKVMRAWGFKPVKVAFVWVKTTAKGKLFSGPGFYTSSNAEYIVLGTKGRPWHANRRTVGGDGVAVPEVVMVPHPRDPVTGKIIHSAKPGVFHDHIVRLFGDLPRLELFARRPAPGWSVAGNQLADGAQIIRPDTLFAPVEAQEATDKVVAIEPYQIRLAL